MRHTPFFLTLSRESQRSSIEALIFASDEALNIRTLYKILILEEGVQSPAEAAAQQEETPGEVQEILEAAKAGDESSEEQEVASESPAPSSKKKSGLPDLGELTTLVNELVQEINADLSATERPYRIVRIAGGYQFATISEFGEVVARLLKARTRRRLSQAALEALAIIAYKQPISKPEIEAIRGINSNEVINSLVEKNLVNLAGRSDAPGKPLLYGTTDDFLRMFGLHSVKDLPKLRELDDLFQNKAAELASGLDISVKTSSGELLEKIQSMVDNEHKMEQVERENNERSAQESHDVQELLDNSEKEELEFEDDGVTDSESNSNINSDSDNDSEAEGDDVVDALSDEGGDEIEDEIEDRDVDDELEAEAELVVDEANDDDSQDEASDEDEV